jgi:hypothetical protein
MPTRIRKNSVITDSVTVVEGVGLPESVALTPVPGTDYGYAYVNSLPVLVEPSTRQVEYIYR